MSDPIPFYSPVTEIDEGEKRARKKKMSAIMERYKDKVSTLPKHMIHHNLCKYEDFWYGHGFWGHQSNVDFSVEAIMASQDDFQALPIDVFLACLPKGGTTWLKALAFTISYRTKFKISNDSCPTHPLRTISPHDCVPTIETESFLTNPSYANGLMATHIPYTSLPKSIISSNCLVVYICRNPKDVVISLWHFVNMLKDDNSTLVKLDDIFELFSRGMNPTGSYWDHVKGYYKASLERPDKVLFLKYEDLQKDTTNEVKKLANFMGYPITEEEESNGTIQGIIELCSFEKLSQVNKGSKDGKKGSKVLSNSIYFRKGKVGDSINYFTPEMIQILDDITRKEFEGLNISF